MSRSSSIWNNPLSITLIILALIWVFAVIRFCGKPANEKTGAATSEPAPPIPDYILLPEVICPLKLSEGDEDLAKALLQQYFRVDSLNRLQEVRWQPDPKIDSVFAKRYVGNWETYIECIQTLKVDSNGISEKLAIMASNFPENDCQNCAPYIGYIRFNMQQDDPSTLVIRDAERAMFTFGGYGAIGDQISLVPLGQFLALAFSSSLTREGYTLGETVIYNLEDFRPLLAVETYESNAGTESNDLFERKGQLYLNEATDLQSPALLALHTITKVLSGSPQFPKEETIFFQYEPDSLRYIRLNRNL